MNKQCCFLRKWQLLCLFQHTGEKNQRPLENPRLPIIKMPRKVRKQKVKRWTGSNTHIFLDIPHFCVFFSRHTLRPKANKQPSACFLRSSMAGTRRTDKTKRKTQRRRKRKKRRGRKEGVTERKTNKWSLWPQALWCTTHRSALTYICSLSLLF